MTNLTESQQQELAALEAMHSLCMEFPGAKEEDVLAVAKTNGNMSWQAMCAYCDAHNTDYPDWPEFAKV